MSKTDTIFATDSFGNITVFDLRIGTTLMHYKSNPISAKCLDVLQDYVIAAEKGPLIHVWPLNSQAKISTIRMVCPGPVNCCAVSPDELYIAVSTGAKLLIWQLSVGELLNTASSHYQSITVVKWSQDGSSIITGGEDGLVCVWKLSHFVSSKYMFLGIKSSDTSNSQVEPRFTFSHHSIKITDIHIGHGGLRARLFTASADKTCRIYDLASGNQLLSIIFDVRPTAIITDVPEGRVFVGMFDGTIKSFSLLEPPRSLDYHYKESESNTVLYGHTKAITCLAFSIDDTTLISGSADETIRLWHVCSKQLIRTIRMKGIVSNLLVRMMPESLQAYELHSTTVIKSFQKRYDDNQEHILEIVPSVDNYSKKKYLNADEGGEDINALNQKIEELRRINYELFNFAKNKIVETDTIVPVKNKKNKGSKKPDLVVSVRTIKNKNKRKLTKEHVKKR